MTMFHIVCIYQNNTSDCYRR